ncbi:MAG: CHAD domain-containing protein, partial [Gammaproteobacteria bacterium]
RAEQRDLGAESVHAIRSSAKRLRALWRLLRTAIDDDVVAAADARLRDSNRRLATARDAHVARKTIDKLVAKCKREKDRKALRAFRDTLPRDAKRMRVSASSASAVEAAYRDEVAAWRALASDAPDQAIVYSGIRRSYRRGQKLAGKAIASERAVHYHRWRRWTKYLLYQLEAPARNLRRVHRARRDRAGTNGALIGQYCG